MFDLKIDTRLNYHCIIAVGVYPASDKPEKIGKMFLKYRPVYFTNDDIKRLRDAVMLSHDKIFKTTSVEAVKLHECSELVNTLSGLFLSSMANKCSLHHFSSKYEIDDSYFKFLINSCNHGDKESLRMLHDSRIRGAGI